MYANQGTHEKYSYIRRDIKPHISDMSATDDFYLELITRSVPEDTERRTEIHQCQSRTAGQTEFC